MLKLSLTAKVCQAALGVICGASITHNALASEGVASEHLLDMTASNLSGFLYGHIDGPSGKEWEDPLSLSLNKEQPHAYFFAFADAQSALGVLPEHSKFYQSLDGSDWKFNWVKHPNERPLDFYKEDFDASKWDNITVPSCWNVAGIQKNGDLKYGVPVYSNQRVIFQHEVKVGDWKGGVMREPPKDWTTYIYRNEVGSYIKSFTVPEDWDGRQVYINFDGVNSFFYLWVNGKYVGFSKNSRNTASFDISSYLKKGENKIAVEVYRNSDGSFLEAQDMYRLPGIFRSTYLTSTSKLQVQDLKINASVEANQDLYYSHKARVDVNALMRNLIGKDTNDGYTIECSIYKNKLYSDEIEGDVVARASSQVFNIKNEEQKNVITSLEFDSPKLWSAEEPNRYTLVAQVKDKDGKVVETISSFFGVRSIEIKDTTADKDEFGLAGRYFYLNGQPIKFKGVNRQEINPESGNTITHEQMEEEIKLMKRGNINHVRNSHYSNNPYWYYLCDKYGIYLEDEANLESHEYYYGDASLSHVPEFRDAHVARVMELVRAHVNHPSILIWSLGNEAGPGKTFVDAYNAIKEYDTSRPVQYERNNNIVDIGSNQYPSIAWTKEAVTGKLDIKYPFHISEYAHSMGNAVGNLVDYWDAIESTNFIMGGAIWDWVDQSLYNYDKASGTKYFAYGGDFGDKPNDGMFCMNGILFPDHSPKPAFYEVKKVYQNIGVKAVDITKGQIEIFNKNYFKPLLDYEIKWSLWKDGQLVEESNNFIAPFKIIGPREKAYYTIPYDYASLDKNSEYYIKVQFLLAKDQPWAKKGFVQMEEQLPVKMADAKPSVAKVARLATIGDQYNLKLADGKSVTSLTGDNFKVDFDNKTGTIKSLSYNNVDVFVDGAGPKLDAFRAQTDNDNWAYRQWFANGLPNLEHKVLDKVSYARADGSYVISYTVESQAPYGESITDLGISSGHYDIAKTHDFGEKDFKFTTNQIWTVYRDGSIELESNINSNNPNLDLARLGYLMQTSSDLGEYKYYGRGPYNNYNDRETGSFVQLYTSTVKDQFVPFPKPQEMGNREDLRWNALLNDKGQGIQIVGTQEFSASALPWSQKELLLAPHPYQLPESKSNFVHIDFKTLGLGGNSCGQGAPLAEDHIKATNHTFGFIIRPVGFNKEQGADLDQTLIANARVSAGGDIPLGFNRDLLGHVDISTAAQNAKILYKVNDGPVEEYNENSQINLRNGGTISAWYADNEKLVATTKFSKIDTIPVKVIGASSTEPGEGNPENAIDHDTNTAWTSMYSVTVAKYPHWIDFDCIETKTINGIKYLPRQDWVKPNIKDYSIQVSDDNQNWKEIAKGSFENNLQEKTVNFEPVKARYLRFVGLNSQTGDDYAACAEFTILAD